MHCVWDQHTGTEETDDYANEMVSHSWATRAEPWMMGGGRTSKGTGRVQMREIAHHQKQLSQGKTPRGLHCEVALVTYDHILNAPWQIPRQGWAQCNGVNTWDSLQRTLHGTPVTGKGSLYWVATFHALGWELLLRGSPMGWTLHQQFYIHWLLLVLTMTLARHAIIKRKKQWRSNLPMATWLVNMGARLQM